MDESHKHLLELNIGNVVDKMQTIDIARLLFVYAVAENDLPAIIVTKKLLRRLTPNNDVTE